MKSELPEKTHQIQWSLYVQHLAYVQWKGKKLGLVVVFAGKHYKLLALETAGKNEQEVLASHAHDYIGDFKTLEKAQASGEAYARAWIRRQRKSDPFASPRCGCGPIRKKSKKKGSR